MKSRAAVIVGSAVAAMLAWAFWTRRARAAPAPAPALPVAPGLPAAPRTLTSQEAEQLWPMPWTPIEGDDSAIQIDPAWKAKNLATFEIPELVGVRGAPPGGRVTLHKDVGPAVQALFRAWREAGLIDRVVSWHGSLAERRIRGKQAVSKHARGVAFDINADANPLGQPPAPAGTPGSVVELVPLAVEHGFTWGGFWKSRPDGMHFEPSGDWKRLREQRAKEKEQL